MSSIPKKIYRNGMDAVEPALPPLGQSPSFMRLAFTAARGKMKASRSIAEVFLRVHRIRQSGEHAVSVALPPGTSRARFLTDVQVLANILYKRNHAYPERLVKWAKEPAFTAVSEVSVEIKVEARIAQSASKTREAQVSCGWNDVGIEDLAVAHGAYFVLTGKDMFAGAIVRAANGALAFSKSGLLLSRSGKSFNDREASENVFASRKIA